MQIASKRVIGFDMMRVIMLLLLIVFHAGVSFMVTQSEEQWFYYDQSNSVVFDGLFGFVHTFRHPSFFLISGMVTELMYRRYSKSEVIKRRFQRLLIPFLIVILTIGPLVHIFYGLFKGLPNPLSTEVVFPNSPDHFFGFDTSYVWFLYYLVVYNVIHYGYQRVKAKLNRPSKQSKSILFIMTGMLFITLSAVLLLTEKSSLIGHYQFWPPLYSIGGYFLFYLFGVFLANRIKEVEKLANWGLKLLSVGLFILTVFFAIVTYRMSQNHGAEEYSWPLMLIYTVATILISFGALGTAIKFYTKPIWIITYISKASYFLYLIHFPFILIFLYLLKDYEWHCFLKFFIVISGTLICTFGINYIWDKAWKGQPPI